MRIYLVFPPYWTPAMPHLALPALSSFLRSRGVEVVQRDLNVEVFDHVLTKDYLTRTLTRLRQQGRRPPAGSPAPPREKIAWALREGPGLAARVEDAVSVIRSPAFLDGPAGLDAFLMIGQSLELASLPFFPAVLELLSYTPAASVDSSRSLLKAVRDEQTNMFLEIFRRIAIPDIVREQPDIVGISIPTEGQMLAGMTLAHLVRQAGVRCHITVGGPHITMLREQLPKVPALFKLIDSAVAFEGEAPLLRLAETLAAGGDLAVVPNLTWRDGAEIRVNGSAAALPASVHLRLKPHADTVRPAEAGSAVQDESVSTDFTYQAPVSTGDSLPDFDGLPLDKYLSPYLVLPLLTAHGCYHGDCAFCNVGYGQSGHFRPLRAEDVVAQMLALQRKHGIRHIFFADEAMTPRSMRQMSALLAAHEREGGTPIHWCGCMRFEKAITPELLAAMAEGGCRMIMFGLETASERMIEHMVKGTQLDHMSRILRESTAAGIWNHTFFFFGFPTETMEDAQDTVNFIYAHGDAIHSASPGEFVLERYSPVHLAPEKFGVRRIKQRPEQDLAIYFDYELESGLDEQMARTITERLLDVLPGKRYGQYYAQDTYRLLYAAYLREQGRPLPGWLVAEEDRAGGLTEPARAGG
jgi:radical SAM superfamily enzyme YgiQ (UPF0313 family)